MSESNLYTIPFRVSFTQFSVVVVLTEGNLTRMRVYDPAEVDIQAIRAGSGPPYTELELADVIICFGTEADITEMTRLITAGQWMEALRYITRGYRFRPEVGDGPAPTIHAKKGN